MRLFHEVRGLALAGNRVTVLAPGSREKVERGIASLEGLGVSFAPFVRPASRAREAAEAVIGDPRIAFGLMSDSWLGWQARIYAREMRGAFAAVRNGRWDCMLLEHDWAVGWLDSLPGEVPTALVFQNLTDSLRRRQASGAHGLDRWRLGRDADLTRRAVRRNVHRVQRAFACSEDDASAIRSQYGLDCAVVPNGADTTALSLVGRAGQVPNELLFTGTMSYPPNAEGITWFVREVLPLVRTSRPDVHLSVVGRDPGPDVLRLADTESVDVTGRVQDLRPYFEKACVVLVPLRSGSGTKLKMIEAMAAGKAIVSTSVGAEGIAGESHSEYVVADSPQDFADALLHVMGSPDLAGSLGDAARCIAREQYSWDAIGRNFAADIDAWLG